MKQRIIKNSIIEKNVYKTMMLEKNNYNYNLLKTLKKYSKNEHFFESNGYVVKKNNENLVNEILRICGKLKEKGITNKIVFLNIKNRKWNFVYTYALISMNNTVGYLYDGFPKEYINQIIDETKPHLIISDNDIISLDNIKKYDITDFFYGDMVSIEECWISNTKNTLIYTSSGTTGVPKIVFTGRVTMFEHAIMTCKYIIEEDFLLYNCLNPAWGASTIMGYFGSVLSGNRIYLSDNISIFKDISNFNKKIKQYAISSILATPVFFNHDCKEKLNIKTLLTTGEKITYQHFSNIINKISKKTEYINLYGQIEFSGAIASSKGLKLNKRNYTFMKPLPWIKTTIQNGILGVVNWQNHVFSKMTNEKLEQSYFTNNIYLTKDLVELAGDDYFKFINRTDNQIKIKGRFVDLDYIVKKIEKDLSKIIKYVIDENSYILLYEGDDKLIPNIEELIIKNIGKYALPKKIMAIKEFPLNNNHKISEYELKKIVKQEGDNEK